MIAENQKFIGVQEGKDGKPFYFPEAMTDQAIDWLHGVRGHEADKPWMLYYSTGCSHAPHHVAKEWSDKYKGKFDQGWDKLREETFERQKTLGVVPADAKLTPRPEEMPAWDSLSENSKRLFAHQMEVYAGLLGERRPPRRPAAGRDRGDGRARGHARRSGSGATTAPASKARRPAPSTRGRWSTACPLTDEEQMQLALKWGGLEAWGTEMMYPHYSTAWAWAGNTPFAWGKQVASHLGGTRNPLVVRYPERIKDGGGLRSQFTHVSDIGPTILDIVGIPQPTHVDGVEQQPMTGVDVRRVARDAGAPERHTQQYFENFGNRAMYKDGWWLAMRMPRVPWRLDPEMLKTFAPGVWHPDDDPVELYYLPDDFSQANDLAADQPGEGEGAAGAVLGRGREVQRQAAARRVLAVLRHPAAARHEDDRTPTTATCRTSRPGGVPRIYNHSYTISADLHIPDGGAEGVIVADASHLGGFSLFVAGRQAASTPTRSSGCSSTARSPTGAADRRRERRAGLRRRRGEAGHAWRRHAVRQRRAGRQRPAGPHGAVRLQRLRGHGRRPGQRPRRRPQLRRQGAVRVHRHRQEGGLRRRPAPGRRRRARPPRARLPGAHRPRHHARRKRPT